MSDRELLHQSPKVSDPVAWLTDRGTIHFDKTDAFDDSDGFIEPLYKHPPNPVVRLSDIEINDEVDVCSHDGIYRFARAIEDDFFRKNGLEVKDD